jgi:hypothetical protein
MITGTAVPVYELALEYTHVLEVFYSSMAFRV